MPLSTASQLAFHRTVGANETQIMTVPPAATRAQVAPAKPIAVGPIGATALTNTKTITILGQQIPTTVAVAGVAALGFGAWWFLLRKKGRR